MKNYSYIFSLGLILFCGSCGFYDEAEVPAAFLKIDSIDQVTTSGQGFNSHKLTDVWVYADTELLGVFTPPIDVPIIPKSDSTEIILFPGIRNNGVSTNPIIYPFMDRYEDKLPLKSGETISINPIFNYRSSAVFEMIEGFEGNHGFTFDADTISSTSLLVSEEEFLEGTRSGHFSIDETNRTVQVATGLEFSTEGLDGREVYLELDYKNDTPLFVGVIARNQLQELKEWKVILPPRDNWNKIYVDFTNELAFSNIEFYRIVFGVTLGSATEGDAYIDNVKLIHF